MRSGELTGTFRFLLTGIVLTALGIMAVATPAVAGTAAVYVIGGMLVIAGVCQIVSAWRAQGWSDKVIPAVIGVITILAGAGALAHPYLGLTYLAITLAIFFAVEGIWKMFAAFSYRPAQGWIAILASGACAVILAIMIWRQWPLSGLWAVGVFVGIDLLVSGLSFIVLAVTIRKLKLRFRDAIEGRLQAAPPLQL